MLEFLKNNFATIITLVIPVGVIFLTGMFIWKSYSLSTIYNKLWSLFYGEKDYYDQEINSFAKQQHDTDKFNFVNGFKFEDQTKIQNFLKYLANKNHRIYWYSNLGKYFDHENFMVTKPKTSDRILYPVLILVACISFIYWISTNQFTNLSGNTVAFDYFTNYVFAAEIAAVILILWVGNKAIRKARKTLAIINPPTPPTP